MNTRSSSYTGRAARSLDDAFGPYARGPIHEPATPQHRHEKIVLWASSIAGIVLLGLVLIGQLK